MKHKILFLIIIGLFLTNLKTFSQCVSPEEAKWLNRLPQSTEKVVSAGEISVKFQLWAVKHKKQWFILSSDSANVYLMVYDKKAGTAKTASGFLASGLIRILQTDNYKSKEKGTKVDDIRFEKYFKPKSKSKKLIKKLLLLENPTEAPKGFFGKLLGLVGLG